MWYILVEPCRARRCARRRVSPHDERERGLWHACHECYVPVLWSRDPPVVDADVGRRSLPCVI